MEKTVAAAAASIAYVGTQWQRKNILPAHFPVVLDLVLEIYLSLQVPTGSTFLTVASKL